MWVANYLFGEFSYYVNAIYYSKGIPQIIALRIFVSILMSIAGEKVSSPWLSPAFYPLFSKIIKYSSS